MNFPRRLVILPALVLASAGFAGAVAGCGDNATQRPETTEVMTHDSMMTHTTEMMTHTTEMMTHDSMMTEKKGG